MNIIHRKIDEANQMHNVLEEGLRRTVIQAIKIGKVLAEIRDECGHGEWKPLFNKEIKISYRSACDYILIAEKCKSANHSSLQDALNTAKQIDYKQKQKNQERRQVIINSRKKTGEKPKEWDRACEYEYKKQIDDSAYEERKEKIINEKKANECPKIDINKIFEELKRTFKKYENLKEGVGGNEDVIAIIEVKISQLPDNSRKHEFCNTLIKFLREKAIHYNRTS
jgi:hypothetical protein